MAKATLRDVQAVAKCRDLVEGLMGEFLQVSTYVILHLTETDAFRMPLAQDVCACCVASGLYWYALEAEVS